MGIHDTGCSRLLGFGPTRPRLGLLPVLRAVCVRRRCHSRRAWDAASFGGGRDMPLAINRRSGRCDIQLLFWEAVAAHCPPT